MLTKLKDFFIIPSAIQSEFQQDSLQKNKLSLWLISIMIFGMELFNLARVLFFSQSRAGDIEQPHLFFHVLRSPAGSCFFPSSAIQVAHSIGTGAIWGADWFGGFLFPLAHSAQCL